MTPVPPPSTKTPPIYSALPASTASSISIIVFPLALMTINFSPQPVPEAVMVPKPLVNEVSRLALNAKVLTLFN